MRDMVVISRKTFLCGNLIDLLLKRSFLFSVFISFFYLVQFCNSASGQERLAVISKFTGDVKIQHEGQMLVVKKIGSRIMNSSIYKGDILETGAGASAEIIYDDASVIGVEEKTSLGFETRELTEKEKADSKKGKGRILKLASGNLWGNITPSKTVLTEFETPTGVASVRGTSINLGFNPDSGLLTLSVGAGLMTFDMFAGEAGTAVNIANIQPGIAMEITATKVVNPDTGAVESKLAFEVTGGALEIKVGGSTIAVDPTTDTDASDSTKVHVTVPTVLDTETETTDATIEVETGAATVTDTTGTETDLGGAGDPTSIETTVPVIVPELGEPGAGPTIETTVETVETETKTETTEKVQVTSSPLP